MWRDHAACAGRPPGLWYPGRYDNTATALAICEGCGVRSECLEAALNGGSRWLGQDWGIWGGTTPEQRAQLRRRTA